MGDSVARKVGSYLAHNHLTLSVCESCTGGMLGALITSIPGSSEYFMGGILAYSDAIKRRVIGVKARTLNQHGAVSREVAREMALAVKKKMTSDIGISITGIAGPSGGSREKPVGLVYVGLAMKRRIVVKEFSFKGGREVIRRSACQQALSLLHEILHETRTKN